MLLLIQMNSFEKVISLLLTMVSTSGIFEVFFVEKLPFNLKTKAFSWVSLHINTPTTTNVFILTGKKKITTFMPKIKAISASRLSFGIHRDSISSEMRGCGVRLIAGFLLTQTSKTLVDVKSGKKKKNYTY